MRTQIKSCIILLTLNCFTVGFAQQPSPEIKIQQGHPAPVLSVCFSQDGRFILSGSGDKTVKLWDVSSGKEIRTFKGHEGVVESVCFSPDGHYALSGSADKTVKLWDIAADEAVRTFRGHTNSVNSVCFSPDGQNILSGSDDNVMSEFSGSKNDMMKLWNLSSDKDIKDFSGFKGSIKSVCFSTDGKYALAGNGRDKTIRIWKISTGKIIRTFSGHSDEITSVTFSRDGRYILSGSDDKTLKLWDTSSGKEIRTFSGHSSGVSSVCFSTDGIFALSGSDDNTLKLWEVTTGRLVRTISGHSGGVSSVCFSPDDKNILSGSYDRTFKLWDVTTGNLIKTFSGNSTMVTSACFSPDGAYSLSGGKDNIMNLWDINKAINVRSFIDHISIIASVCFSPDGKYGLSASYDSTLKIWDLATGALVNTLIGHAAEVTSATFSHNGRYVLSGSGDKSVKLWDISNGKMIKTFNGQSQSVCFSPDDKFVLSGAWDKTLKLWDISSGKLIRTFTANSQINTVALSPDGEYALSGSGFDILSFLSKIETTLKLWKVSNGKELRTMQGHLKQINSVCFSPDGKFALSGSSDNTLKLWEVSSGKLIRTFSGHSNSVNSVCFSPDGKSALSGSGDNTFKLWDIMTGELIYTAIINGKNSQWLVYNNDGYWDASPNGGDLVAMVRGTEVWNIDQFAVKNNRPDLILKKVANADPQLISHYYNQYLKRLRKLNLSEDKLSKDYEVPEVKINKTTQNDKNVILDFSISSKTAIVLRYNIFVNDVPLFGAYGKNLSPAEHPDLKSIIISETLELTTGTNKIEISAMNEFGAESYRALTFANYSPAIQVKPDLYYLGFGVSKYFKPELNLQYADKDAKDLANILEKMNSKGQFANVYSRTILNEEVTPESIKNAKDFLKNAKPDDTFILFIAGHGTHDNDKEATYYYLTSKADPGNLKNTAADFETIEDLLQGIAPRNKLFLMDACESGELDDEVQTSLGEQANLLGMKSRGFKPVKNTNANQSSSTGKRSYLYQKDRYIYNDLVRRSGAVVFSSSKGGELSYERSDLKNGLFTYYIMKALASKSEDKNNDGIISTDELREYVSSEVARASGDLQHPVVDRDNIYQKFGFNIK